MLILLANNVWLKMKMGVLAFKVCPQVILRHLTYSCYYMIIDMSINAALRCR